MECWLLNPFDSTGLFLNPLKISKYPWFSDVFRGYRNRPEALNRSSRYKYTAAALYHSYTESVEFL